MSILSRPYFHNEEAAFAHVESVMWPSGPECPHCGCVGRISKIKANPEKRVRLGLHKCGDCKKQFTVKVGTVFEDSKVPLHKWLQAVYLMTSSKKGVSSHQLYRALEVTYKTAWFMTHRIREAMRSGDLAPFGADGGVVEVDETFIGNDRSIKPKHTKKGRGYAHKHKVLSLVDRTTGRARNFVVDDLKAATLVPILRENIAKEATIYTDEAGQYRKLAAGFAGHDFVRHGAGEYGRGEVHTNTIEGYFSVFKRGMKGVYQHCGKRHLHRYMAEFGFRYDNRSANGVEDVERADRALRGARGKRLKYQGPDSKTA
ncbi:IS1595 family transposase [Roseitranquillus sediminis]|uniref:IS1595 family transposase n=1 Tax=Roseitranquillus sediminis TaxID=2809051 RepID=UPI001D0C504E|nr:IS1595 family transposase [Roseitranquillus sediminis]MBM9594467.1 IS1595 family transposase [Roseitranquillus sediminis]